MVWQTQSNGDVRYKVQSALGTAASGAGATLLRTAGGTAGRLTKSTTESNEIRSDGMMSRGRHGSWKTAGSYDCELSLDQMDDVFEAVFRGTWASALVITEATAGLTSITTTTSTIVAGGGSWITAGLRVGDVVRLTNHTTAGNNNINLRIKALTATVLTVVGTPLTLNATPDTAFTITRPGQKLINPASGALVKRYFTVEEYEQDIDASEIFQDCVWGSIRLAMAPNGLVTVTPAWVGSGQFTTQSGAGAPSFTSPTVPTGVPLAVVDAALAFNGTDFVDLTAFDITLDITPNAPDVAASRYAPDVFTGQMAVSMSITALRSDLQRVADFSAETVCSLQLFAVENEAEPKDFFSLYVPNFTLGSVDKSALSKAGGPRTQTMAVPAALVGIDNTGGAFDSTMVKIIVSNT
jgi:hypothetical protein